MTDALTIIEPDEDDQPGPQALTLFGTSDPLLVIGKASRVALALAQVIKAQHLTTRIGTKEYVHVEGWTLLGSMLGVTPQIEWTRKLENGWEARAIAVYNATGGTVGAGEAQCSRSEATWAKRDDFAIRAMAQTRAVSRALRGPLGFVVVLAGFAATPADEMPPTADEEFHAKETARRAGTAPPNSPRANPPTAPSPAARNAAEVLGDIRAKRTPSDDELVCASCGRKEFLRPYQGSYFCSKRDGGCGSPPKGEVMRPVSYGEWKSKAR